jgi:hypothetical protein
MIFDSSRSKLAWAKKHIADLEREINAFAAEQPYARIHEPHPERTDCVVVKIKLTKQLPVNFALIASDAAVNLRSVLDHACYAVAVASGNIAPKYAQFPFAGTAERFEDNLRGSKDLPEQIRPIFRSFQPYKGGNGLLYALNQISNTNKHVTLVALGAAVIRQSGKFHAVGYMSVPTNPVWDNAKNEIIVATIGHGTKFDYDVNFAFFVTFNEVEGISGQEAVRVLNALASEVERVLMAIEAESRRIGILS